MKQAYQTDKRLSLTLAAVHSFYDGKLAEELLIKMFDAPSYTALRSLETHLALHWESF